MNRSTYRVIYADTDQMGVVYHANYLALFERSRCEYMRAQNFDYRVFEQEGFFLPVVEANIRYRAPARFDDLLTLEVVMHEASRVTASFRYRVLRDDTVLCEGTTMHACVNSQGRAVRLPASLAALFPADLLPAAGFTSTR